MYWSKNFAYIVGLMATDGNLSKDGRHFDFTSKDLEQIRNFKNILNLKNKIGKKNSGSNSTKIYHRVQFGNVKLYKFLLSIGLHPNKTKTLAEVNIPDIYFADYLRGYLDGDGYSYSYWDKRWRSSFLLYIGFVSASRKHLEWLKDKISKLYKAKGAIKYGGKSAYQLVYAKASSIILSKKIYYTDNIICLKRKRFKIEKALGIIDKQAGMLKLVNRHA